LFHINSFCTTWKKGTYTGMVRLSTCPVVCQSICPSECFNPKKTLNGFL
jgi:hypothetical protein